MTLPLALAAALCVALLLPGRPLRRLDQPARRPVAWRNALRRLGPRPAADRVVRRQAPVAMEFLAVCLDAGAPVASAVASVVEVSPDPSASLLGRVLAHLDVGRAPEEAWAELRNDPVWGPAARDFVRSARSGTALSEALRRHAADLRQVQHDEETKRARTVGVKSVCPLMGCFLPAFVLVGVIPIIAGLLGDFFG